MTQWRILRWVPRRRHMMPVSSPLVFVERITWLREFSKELPTGNIGHFRDIGFQDIAVHRRIPEIDFRDTRFRYRFRGINATLFLHISCRVYVA